MKTYFTFIAYMQNILMTISMVILLTLPFSLAFFPDSFGSDITNQLYAIAHYALLFVMSIRPLADILPQNKWVRPLVILRKGMGVFSASIIISFIFAKIIVDPGGYVHTMGTLPYWSFTHYAIFAHLADISAFILLITSNKFSKRILKKNWKRIQRLSYVYFFGSSFYLYAAFHDTHMLYYMLFVGGITMLAYIKNRQKKQNNL